MNRVVLLASLADSVVEFRGALIRELRLRGAAVVVVAPPAAAEIVAGIESLGVRFIPIDMQRNRISPLADLVYVVRLWRMLRKLRPDSVLAYTMKPIAFGASAAMLAGVKNVSVMFTGLGYAFTSGSKTARMSKSLIRGLLNWVLGRCHRVIFQNPDDREYIVNEGISYKPDRGLVVNGSGVPLERYQYAAPSGGHSFLMIARLVREKGVIEYLQAARLVHEQYPEVRISLLGWRDEGVASVPEAEFRELLVSGGVKLLDRTNDVRPFLRNCGVYVLPSYREGMPRTVLEAMAIGRPVITTDVPGCRQTVAEGETGWLVEPRSATALAAAMMEALRCHERWLAMGVAARSRVEKLYDANSVAHVVADAMGVHVETRV